MARRDGEDVLRALRAEPADRQEAETPIAGEREESGPEAPLRAPRGSEADRQEAVAPVPEEEAAGIEEEPGDLQGRPGELLRTLRQSAPDREASEA